MGNFIRLINLMAVFSYFDFSHATPSGLVPSGLVQITLSKSIQARRASE